MQFLALVGSVGCVFVIAAFNPTLPWLSLSISELRIRVTVRL